MDTYYVRNINMGYYGRLPAGNLKQLAKGKKRKRRLFSTENKIFKGRETREVRLFSFKGGSLSE